MLMTQLVLDVSRRACATVVYYCQRGRDGPGQNEMVGFLSEPPAQQQWLEDWQKFLRSRLGSGSFRLMLATPAMSRSQTPSCQAGLQERCYQGDLDGRLLRH